MTVRLGYTHRDVDPAARKCDLTTRGDVPSGAQLQVTCKAKPDSNLSETNLSTTLRSTETSARDVDGVGGNNRCSLLANAVKHGVFVPAETAAPRQSPSAVFLESFENQLKGNRKDRRTCW